jgi:hypothetical protein
MARLYPQTLDSLSVASYELPGYGGGLAGSSDVAWERTLQKNRFQYFFYWVTLLSARAA